MEKQKVVSLMSKEDWLKGMLGLNIFKDALIPSLEGRFSQWAEELNTDDDHLKHLLDLAAKMEVKLSKKTPGSIWTVNCSDCRPILDEIEKSHIDPEHLIWVNNKKMDDCPNEYRLARLFMTGGSEECQNYSNLDALNVLEILKNDKSFGIRYDEITFLILFRNRLVHSSTNCISEEERDEAFDNMKKLLESGKFKELQECISAVEDLDKLKSKPMTCGVDESNENWQLALAIQTQANKEEGIKSQSPEKVKILLKDIQLELQKEKEQLEKVQLQLSNASDKSDEYQVELLKVEDDRSHYNTEQIKLQKEKDSKEKPKPSILRRVAAGGSTGAGFGGLSAGPFGALIGGTAGAVVGGMTYFWDKFINDN